MFSVAKDFSIETASPRVAPRRERPIMWPLGLAVLIWCSLIAASSSTVVLPRTLFGWLREHVFENDESLRRFMSFWGYAWFTVVKGWHAAEFAILFTLIHALLKRRDPSRPRRNLLTASALALLFAISDEYHQTHVPGRGGNGRDVAIDGLGIGLAALVARRRRGPIVPPSLSDPVVTDDP